MTLSYFVAGVPHAAAIPDVDELPDAVAIVHQSIVATCGAARLDKYLEARVTDGVLEALVEQIDFPIGEVLANPSA